MNQEAVYIGRRINGENVAQAFLIGESTLLFKGIRGVVLGCTYEYKGDGKMSVQPARIDKPREDRTEWDAKDALAEDFMAKKRAEKKMNDLSRPAYRAAVAAIRPLLKGLSTYEIHALLGKLFAEVR